MTIGLLGFGTVGVGVYELLKENKNIKVKYVLDLKIHNDIDAISTTDINDILSDSEVDTVVELIGGLNVAYGFVKSALEAGKNVITANKYLISNKYNELTSLAKQNGAALRYTAAVGGGIQWLVNLERTLRVAKVNSIYGILNGTTNFILDAMHTSGEGFDEALAEAQKLGYAEADPSADIDGLDSLRKIIISSNIAFGVSVNTDDTDVFGIRSINHSDIKMAEFLGCTCKLIAYTKCYGKKISLYVEPTFVNNNLLEASVKKNFNIVTLDAENVGKQSYYGYGAGRYPTAYTVVEDCIDVANGVKKAYNDVTDEVAVDNTAEEHKYYVRTDKKYSYIESITESICTDGIITKSVKVSEMHKFANEVNKNGGTCFIAGIM